MSHILFIYETEMPTVSITEQNWMNFSKISGIEARFVRLISVKTEDINWCDVLVMIRPNNAYSWRIAAKARKSGRFIITMCDDNLLHLPKSHPDLPWQRKGLIKSLNQSNALMTNSPYLMKEMIDETTDKREVYIHTAINPKDIVTRNYDQEDRDIVKIVYAAGGGQHEKMFEKLVLPALQSILSQTTQKISLTFVAVHPDCSVLNGQADISYIKGMPLLEYRRYMEEQKFDIGVSPLEDNDFTKCKYFNKYLEYTYTGILGIYSQVEPYTYVIQDGKNGFLAENDIDAWKEKLLTAIENETIRRKCAEEAQKQVLENYNEGTLLNRLFSDVPEFRESNPEKEECESFYIWRRYYQILRGIEFIYKMFFYMKIEGPDSVKRKIKARLNGLIKRTAE